MNSCSNHDSCYVTLADVLGDLCAEHALVNQYVYGITSDSRQVAPGYLFMAYPGGRFDGRAFISDAVARGVTAIVYESSCALSSEIKNSLQAARQQGVSTFALPDCRSHIGAIAARYYSLPSLQMSVIAVTGTNGKSSVATIVSEALQIQQHPVGVIGTLGWGQPGQLRTASLTTPDPIKLQSYCAVLRDAGVHSLIIEASSHALEQKRLHGLNLDMAVFTNLTRDHLDYHENFAAYGQAKLSLFLRPGLQHAVLNLDDPFAQSILDALPAQVEVIGVSQTQRHPSLATCYAEGIQISQQGVSFLACTPWGQMQLSSPLQGRFQVTNLLLSLPVLVSLGLSFSQACAALEAVQEIPGRAQCFGGNGQPNVIVDYAHTPDALSAILTHARTINQGRLWCVFGCGGERDQGKRAQMGQIAERLSDAIVLTDDNPRDEAPENIVQDICQGILCPWAITIEHDRCAAIQYAIANASAEDTIVVAGKGHEQVQVIAGEYLSHSDIDHVQSRLSVWSHQLSRAA